MEGVTFSVDVGVIVTALAPVASIVVVAIIAKRTATRNRKATAEEAKIALEKITEVAVMTHEVKKDVNSKGDAMIAKAEDQSARIKMMEAEILRLNQSTGSPTRRVEAPTQVEANVETGKVTLGQPALPSPAEIKKPKEEA